MKRREFLKALGLSAAVVTFAGPLAAVPVESAPAVAGDGWATVSAESLTVGDIFTISGEYAVNPITGRETAFLQQHVITEISDGGVAFMPSIRGRRRISPSDVQPVGTWQ